jgi:hypothetical protein
MHEVHICDQVHDPKKLPPTILWSIHDNDTGAYQQVLCHFYLESTIILQLAIMSKAKLLGESDS